jgi:glycosyltransferase involved in cell wall biosynthesis
MLEKASIIQVEHPWLFDFAQKNHRDSLLVSISHNCEYALLENSVNNFLRKNIQEIERRSIEEADIVFAVSNDDVLKFQQHLNIYRKKDIYIIPNGVDCSKIKKTAPEERVYAKKTLGFQDKNIIIFTGSIHTPNREAVHIIQNDLSKMIDDKDTIFLIVGSIGKKQDSHDNIIFTGFVNDLDIYLKAADIAICPLRSGSGTSLKMLEYMAYGLPTIATPIGARGLSIQHKKHGIVCDIADFDFWIHELLRNREMYSEMSTFARNFVKSKYDWKLIANEIIKIYNKYLDI